MAAGKGMLLLVSVYMALTVFALRGHSLRSTGCPQRPRTYPADARVYPSCYLPACRPRAGTVLSSAYMGLALIRVSHMDAHVVASQHHLWSRR